MSVTIEVHTTASETRIIDITGDVDIYTSSKLSSVFADLFDKQHFLLIVNLERVRSVDSTGLAVLVRALKFVRANNGRLDLVGVNPVVRKVLEITGLAKAYNVFGNEPSTPAATTN